MIREIFTSQRQFINYFFDHVDVAQAERVLKEFLACKGMLIFTGVGKSGMIADKLAKTMVSTGTRAMFLPPTNALHGDIGMLNPDDLIILISKSGKSSELVNFASVLHKRGSNLMAWVSDKASPLQKVVSLTVELPVEREICPFDLAPTTSTAIQLIFGDIIAVALMRAKKFSIDQFAKNHPGGAIGRLIAEVVQDIMVSGDALPTCYVGQCLQELLVKLTSKKLGCLIILDANDRLQGIFTDGDLRRALEKNREKVLDTPIENLMTKNCHTITANDLTSNALQIMKQQKVLMLPVVQESKVIGLIHMHQIVRSVAEPIALF